MASTDRVKWNCRWLLEKYDSHQDDPYAAVAGEGNMLMYGGASIIWGLLIADGSTDFSAPYIGVGDSYAASDPTFTDLQGSSTFRGAMDAGFPAHTDGFDSAAASIQFKTVFGPSDANFDWQEWGIFNGASGGRMLNRAVTSFGPKVSGAVWTFTITISLE